MYIPATEIGPLDTLIDRIADNATEAAGVQATVSTDAGVSPTLVVTGDATAAVREAVAACIAHQLDGTRHPAVSNYLLRFRDAVGLGD